MGQYDAQIASLASSFKSGGGGKVTGSTRLGAGGDFMSLLKQHENAWKANAPQPLNDQENRISKSFMTLPAASRADALNRLHSAAVGGDLGAQRKLAYLVPAHNDNVPAEQQFQPGSTFHNKILDAASNLATAGAKGLVEAPLRGGRELTDLATGGKSTDLTKLNVQQLTGQQPYQIDQNQKVNPKQFAADVVNTGLLGYGGAETAAVKGLSIADRIFQGAKVGAKVGAIGNSAQAVADNKSLGGVGSAALQGAAGGAALGGAGGALAGILRRGAAASHAEATASNADVAPAKALPSGAVADQKALPAPKTGLPVPRTNVNESTAVIPGTPGSAAEPKTIPLTKEQYSDRFNAISKSYDQQTKAAQAITAPLRQRIVLDHIDQQHQDLLHELNNDAQNGVANPSAKEAVAAVPDKTVPTGFTLGDAAKLSNKEGLTQQSQHADLRHRINQIDSIIHQAANKGTQHSADDLRGLLREKAAAQDVLTGRRSFESVYSPTPVPGKEPALGAVESPAPAPAAAPLPKPVAFDYVPGKPETVPVPQSQLHPGARNLFDETLPVAPGDTKSPVNNRNFVSNTYHAMANKLQRTGSQLSPENISKIDQIELPDRKAGEPPITAQDAAAQVQKVAATIADPKQRDLFLKTVDLMKQGTDTRYAGDVHGLGREVGYRHNYVPHIYEHEGQPESPHGGGVPGYAKNRVIATRAEAEALSKQVDENGNPVYPNLKLKGNALEAQVQALHSAGYEHGTRALARGIESAHPGVETSNKVNNGYQQLRGTNVTVPRGIAPGYNRRLGTPGEKASLPVRIYDKVNQALKTSILGGGTFHGFTTAGTTAGQQLASGKLFTPEGIAQNLNIIKGTFSKAAHAENMARAQESGLSDFARKVGTTLDYNGNLDVARTHIPLIHDIHDAVFQRQIPEAKLMILEQQMRRKFGDVDFHAVTPEQAAYGREIASQVNNLGGINRAVEGLSAAQAKVVGRFVLAPDYTEGKFRTIANALTDRGPKGTIARQAVVGKSVLFALPGLIALTATGKLDWNDPKAVETAIQNQILDPQIPLDEMGQPTKSNPGGAPRSAHLPSTFISEIGKIIAPVVAHLQDPTGNPDALAGIKSYATNRAAAAIGTTARLVQNKDFYGNTIIGGTDKNGNPNGVGQSALNVASQVLPIPITQGIKQGTGQQTALDTALNTAGFRVANDSSSAQAGHSASVTKLYNAFTPALKQKTTVAKQVTDLIAKNKVNEAHRVANDWNARLKTYQRDYPDNFNPDARAAWDTKWKSLELKTSSRADLTRAKDAKANAALLK